MTETLMDELLTVTAQAEDNGKRADRFLADELEDLSRSRIANLIESGFVTQAGKSVKAGTRIRGGESFLLRIPPAEVLSVEPENIPLDIVFEDEDLLIVNKPRGMVVHPAPGNYSGTLVNALMYHFRDHLSTINGVMRPGIVHRIDKDTSGLLLVCKSDRAHRIMAERLKNHDIERVYHALVHGNLTDDQGTVDAPLGRDPKDRKRMAIVSGGRRAVTHYRVLERFGELTYVEARLETGRTHQIRVHMRSIGHPLLGDPLYGPEHIRGGAKALLSGVPDEELQYQLLTACVLGFEHPITGQKLHFECCLPDDFSHILLILRQKKQ